MRYIDADELLRRLAEDLPYKANVRRVLTQAPTADAAPRAEVAREIFEEIERLLDNYHYSTHLVGEIAPLAYYDVELEDALAELKKKYTGESHD